MTRSCGLPKVPTLTKRCLHLVDLWIALRFSHQDVGGFFNERVAGNIANEDIIGRLEWASKVASSKRIVVCGDFSSTRFGG